MVRSIMIRLAVVLALAFMAFSLGSCTLAKISGRGSVPLMLNNPPTRVDVISHFQEQKMVTFDYTSSFDVSEIIAEKLAKTEADAVTNLTIEVKTDVAAYCVNVITLGLANAKVFSVEGDLIKAPQGLGSLLESGNILAEAKTVDELKEQLKKLQNEGNYPTIVRTNSGFALVSGL